MRLAFSLRRRLRPYAPAAQAAVAVAVLGLVALLDALARLPFEGGPPLPSTRRFLSSGG